MSLGRDYNYQALGEGECLFHQDQLTQSNIDVGSEVTIDVVIDNLLNMTAEKYNDYALKNGFNVIESTDNYTYIEYTCKVVGLMPSSLGKYGEAVAVYNVIMEQSHFFSMMAHRQLPNPSLYETTHFADFLLDPKLVTIEEYADHLVVNLPSPRTDWYASTNYDKVQRNIVQVADKFVQTLGFYPMTAQMFILEQMEILNISILFLGLVFNVILLVFIVISVLLIYSLLMIGVETKAMETGIMRMMGTNKRGLVMMVAI